MLGRANWKCGCQYKFVNRIYDTEIIESKDTLLCVNLEMTTDVMRN